MSSWMTEAKKGYNEMRTLCGTILAAACALGAAFAAVAADKVAAIDFSKEAGPVKPVNGVGQPPMVGQLNDWSMMHYLKEAGIPYSRLHDVGGWLGHGLYVDIPNLFPDFDADENDPKNYRFAYTDPLMKALVANGVEPFFRLGVTIENFVERGYPPVNIKPPKDFAKWARICEHVIRHYTEGWANGFRMKIAYWEIWNEPDNNPDENVNPMWRAPFSEYIRLYGTAAPYLKSKFPHLKIGGYASCGFYAGVGSDCAAAANSSPRTAYFVECAHKFLAAARDNQWPLDFFSYHSYSSPAEALRQVRFADTLLCRYGFPADKCERIFNEWLPAEGGTGSVRQAAAVAAELIGLQNGPCDAAMIYDARCGVGTYSPLFNPLTCKPHKAYYAFVAFNELRKLGTAVPVSGSADAAGGDLWLAAAKSADGRKGAVMAVNLGRNNPLPLPRMAGGMKAVGARAVDSAHDFEPVPLADEIGPHTILLIDVE